MTNQETIANLNMISVAFVEPVTKEQRKLIDDTFDKAKKALEQEPKYCDRNICVSNEYNGIGCDECEITKSQDQKKSCNTMDFPNTFDEFAKDYGFKDSKEVYTNGSDLIPVFRVKQWLEYIEPKTGHWIMTSIERRANDKRQIDRIICRL